MAKRPDFEPTNPEPITEERWHESRGDQARAVYDFLKHISTLDSGAVLIVATFMEKLFPHPRDRLLAGVAVMGFLLSLAAAGFTYLILLSSYPRVGNTPLNSSDRRIYMVAMSLTLFGFLSGSVALSMFFLTNWFGK